MLSRIIGGIDRAVVLSEIHPDRHLPQVFNPIFQFRKSYGLDTPEDQATFDHVFVEEIRAIQNICKRENRVLFVRDHYHRDIIVNRRSESRLTEVLLPHFNIKRIYTFRDPLEVWTSMKLKNWLEGASVDEFLDLQVRALDEFRGDLNLNYHDACVRPGKFKRAVFDYAGMSEAEGDFGGPMDDRQHYTGQSGRFGKEMAPRPTRWGALSDGDILAFANSPVYAELCQRTGLKLIPDRDIPPRVQRLLNA